MGVCDTLMLVVGPLIFVTEECGSGQAIILVTPGKSVFKRFSTTERLEANTFVKPGFSLKSQMTSFCHSFQVVAMVQSGG